MPADGRFAPSPSSDLHLGNLRTALLAWLAARCRGAGMRLRVDDLDTGRSRADVAERQLADLAALGLTHDGPVTRQSERLPAYADAFAALQAGGAVYPCYCTRAEIRDAARAPHGPAAGGYPGTCRDLTGSQRAERAAEGRRPAWRLRAEPTPVVFDDAVLGRRSAPAEDAVLRRADGEFGYQLAVVVDDHEDGVGQVVRGADLLGSVGTQRRLQDLLGLPHVEYGHVPLMLGADGQRLAKRHGAATLADVVAGRCELRLPGLECGVPASPRTLRGALAASAGLAAPGADPSLEELVAGFSLARVPRESTMMESCSSR